MRANRLATSVVVIAPVNAAICMGVGTMAINGILRAGACPLTIGRPQDGALAGLLGGIPTGLIFRVVAMGRRPLRPSAGLEQAMRRQAVVIAAITGGLLGGALGGAMIGSNNALRPPRDENAVRAGAVGLACVATCMAGLWPILHYLMAGRTAREEPAAGPTAAASQELV